MIIAIIFALHFIFGLFVFTKVWQDESLGSAFINIILIIIIFSVGWPILTMLTKILFEKEGLGFYMDRDTITLSLLTIVEYFFYKFYYGDRFSTTVKETEEPINE